jgi:protein-tyrosine phosphatase
MWSADLMPDYQALGIRTIIDLRGSLETAAQPSAWPQATGATLIHLPLGEGAEGDATDVMKKLLAGEIRSFGVEDLAGFYARNLHDQARTFGRILTELSRADRLPALVHCQAGKDRTGLLMALVLEALETPRETVIADYALTGLLRPNRVALYMDILEPLAIDPEAVSALFDAPPEALSLTLDRIDDEFGSVQDYLHEAAELSFETLNALRENLLDPVSRMSAKPGGDLDR